MEIDNQVDYGKLNKRIVFTENDHRHVKFLLKLKSIGMTQSKFFRLIITGIIEDNKALYQYIHEYSDVSLKKKQVSKKLREQGESAISELGLNDNEVENIFDMIAEEFPLL